jgi:hypothetical protein
MEKLEIMIKLASDRNIDQVLYICMYVCMYGVGKTRRTCIFFIYELMRNHVGCVVLVLSNFQVLLEFKEYATEVDVDFVRKAVRAIGRCAIKLERAAERCISVLLELIKIKVNYVVQEAIIVIKDIFRRYPNT